MSNAAVVRTLIIGYGNPLRSDDAFGQHAAQHLSTHLPSSDVEVIGCQQLTPDLAETASHFQRVIFIDAAHGRPPGELRCERIPADSQPSTSSFSHSLTPATVLAWTATLYAKYPDAYQITVGATSFAEGESLSPTAQAGLEPLLAQVRSLIAQK